jgi:hypothetical protein
MKCELCEREILSGDESSHHLTPKSRGGEDGPCAVFHDVCHKQIHALFRDKDLERRYNTVSKLKDQPDVKRFVEWIRKKDPGFNMKIRIANRKR